MSTETKVKFGLAGISAVIFFAVLAVIISIAGRVGAADKTYTTPMGATAKWVDLGNHHAQAVYPDDYTWNKMFASSGSTLTLTGSTIFIVVDASDAVNFPHGTANSNFFLKDVTGTFCLDADTGLWEVYLGIVTEQDGSTSGSAYYFDSFIITGKGCEQFPKAPNHYPPAGLNLSYENDIPVYFGTVNLNSDTVTYSTTTSRITFVATSEPVGLGDVVMRLVERTDGAALQFSVGMLYRGE